jgi:ABC-type nitrate/sulfonate/bicarbonate transport system substrate-binding protein
MTISGRHASRRRTRYLRNIFAAILLAPILIAAAACGSSGSASSGGSKNTAAAASTTISIGYVKSLVMAGVYSIPSFAHGINIKLVPFSSGVDEANALNAGSVQFAGLAWQQFLPGLAQGNDWTAVAGIGRGGLEIIASKKIVPANEIDSKTDAYTGTDPGKLLIGKNIGVLPATFPYYALQAWLKDQGVNPNTQVHLVNAPTFGDLNTALGGGGIAAASSLDPYPVEPRSQGQAVLLAFPYPQGSENYLQLSCGLIATSSYVKNNPAVVQAVVTALNKASTQLMANPSQWVNTVLDYAPFPKSMIQLSLDPKSQGVTDTSSYVNNYLDTGMYSGGLMQWVTLLHSLGAMPTVITQSQLANHLNYTFLEKATGHDAAQLGQGQ